jgi:hypothetical protein
MSASSTAMTVPERTHDDFGWTERPRLPALWEPLLDDSARVSLGMVASAHHLAVSHDRPEVREEARLLKRHLRAKFERQQGPIRNSYFCQRLPGGIAVIEEPVALHTVLNSDNDRLVALEADCHALAHQVHTAFAGSRSQQPLTDGIYSAMTRVLAAADTAQKNAPPTALGAAAQGGATSAPAADTAQGNVPPALAVAAQEGATSAPAEDIAPALAAAEAEVEHVRKRVEIAIQRQARFVYFQGALYGTVVAAVICVLLGLVSARFWADHIDTGALVASALFGALGAVVSVFQRISTGQLTLDFNASRGQLLSLGGLRPLVGAVFGTVAQFALGAGLFGVADRPATALGVFALIGFAAGFSERFATDMVERAGQVLAGQPTKPDGEQAL